MIRNTFMLVILVSLISCAAPNQSPYQREDSRQGYSEIKTSPTTYNIYFKGNYNTDLSRANDFALLRAAELTLDSGYRYLKVIFSESTYNEKTVLFSQPVIINETHSISTVNNVKVCGIDKSNRYDSTVQHYSTVSAQMENTHYSNNGRAYSAISVEYVATERVIKKPVSEIHVEFFHEFQNSDNAVEKADDIINRITKKYQVSLNTI